MHFTESSFQCPPCRGKAFLGGGILSNVECFEEDLSGGRNGRLALLDLERSERGRVGRKEDVWQKHETHVALTGAKEVEGEIHGIRQVLELCDSFRRIPLFRSIGSFKPPQNSTVTRRQNHFPRKQNVGVFLHGNVVHGIVLDSDEHVSVLSDQGNVSALDSDQIRNFGIIDVKHGQRLLRDL